MRLIANIKNNENLKRAMLFLDKNGCYLFLYDKGEDCACVEDLFFSSIEQAKNYCKEHYGIELNLWGEIPDALEFCQSDWIFPVRVKGREKGLPKWGKFEKFENGAWIDI